MPGTPEAVVCTVDKSLSEEQVKFGIVNCASITECQPKVMSLGVSESESLNL